MDVTIYAPRMLEESDYPTLLKWWKKYDFAAPAKEFLPDNGTCGIMLEDQWGKQLCAGFIYFTNSKVCWMEFIVANPEFRGREKRNDALNQLIEYLSQFAEEEGARWIFTSVRHEGLAERYAECGFTVGSENTKEMIKQL